MQENTNTFRAAAMTSVEAYLGPCKRSLKELFCGNSERLSAINYFHKKLLRICFRRFQMCLCVKSVRVRIFYSPYFPTFELSMERYSVSLRIQSKCAKIRTRKVPNKDTFHAVCVSAI